MIKNLITHSGGFHADDVCAYTILHDLYPDAKLTRTRDKSQISELGKEGITFDVGDQFNPQKRQFDHHQPNAPKRENGDPFSAFGLVWQEYGQEWLEKCAQVPKEHSAATHKRFEDVLVKHIDMVDNAQVPDNVDIENTLSAMVHRSNLPTMTLTGEPKVITPEEDQEAFTATSQRIKPFLMDHAHSLAREEVTKSILNEKIDPKSQTLELDRPLPWRSVLPEMKGAEHLTMVIAPNSDKSEWVLGMVPTKNEGFIPKKRLPESWAGKRGDELEAVTNIPNMHFCHAGRWMAAGSTLDAAQNMAQTTAHIWKQDAQKEGFKAKLAQDLPPVQDKPAPKKQSQEER